MTESNHSSRSIWFDAATQLKEAGYESIRASGPARPFDLVAWNKDQIIFLVVRRTRNSGISKYADEVFNLVDKVRTGIPGQVQFWLYRSQNWLRYRIMPGGALPVVGGSL